MIVIVNRRDDTQTKPTVSGDDFLKFGLQLPKPTCFEARPQFFQSNCKQGCAACKSGKCPVEIGHQGFLATVVKGDAPVLQLSWFMTNIPVGFMVYVGIPNWMGSIEQTNISLGKTILVPRAMKPVGQSLESSPLKHRCHSHGGTQARWMACFMDNPKITLMNFLVPAFRKPPY